MKRREFFKFLAWAPAAPVAAMISGMPAEAKGDGISIDGSSLYLSGRRVMTARNDCLAISNDLDRRPMNNLKMSFNSNGLDLTANALD